MVVRCHPIRTAVLILCLTPVFGPALAAPAEGDLKLPPRAKPQFKTQPDWFASLGRNVHIDFHTPGWAKVGEKFRADEFGATVKNANASAAVVFANDHHGFAYYPSKAGVPHPKLDFDLLGAEVMALRERGIRVFAYFSANVNGEQNRRHADWRMVHENGQASQGAFSGVCFNSPYRAEVLIPQLEEVVRAYPVDGLWIDMMGYGRDVCFCSHCEAKAGKLKVNLRDPNERHRFTEEIVREVVHEIHERIKAIRPTVILHFNHLTKFGMRAALADEDLSNVESPIPLLNYTYFPTYARYVRTLGQPFGGVTNRFDVGYGRFGTLKSEAMLEYEFAGMLSSGGICTVVDQAPHHMKLEAPAYERLRSAFGFAKEREAWCLGAVSVPDIAVLAPNQTGYFGWAEPDAALYGAVLALTELHQQFDVIDDAEDFARYRLVVLPGASPQPSDAALERLERFVAQGGRVLAVDLDPSKVPSELAEALSVAKAEPSKRFGSGYIRPATDRMGSGLPKMDLLVGAKFRDIVPKGEPEVLAWAVMPIGDQFYGHAGPPASEEPSGPAIVAHAHGQGKTAYVGLPLLSVFYSTPTLAPRLVFGNTLDALLPRSDRLLEVEGPLSVEVNLMAQPGRRILHLINFHAERQRGDKKYTLEDVLPARMIHCRVELPNEPTKVYLAPSGKAIASSWRNGRAEVTVPEVAIHEMVVFEGIRE
jgi:hypothetical protein